MVGSPLRLDLSLRCTPKSPVRETLGVWPPLPIEVLLEHPDGLPLDNIISIFEHRDRIRKIHCLNLTYSQLERLLPMMLEPFPALTSLTLWTLWDLGATLALPNMFLGGSAPRLQSLSLRRIQFPGLPRLLFSATDLSQLSFSGIRRANHISPEAIVTCLSGLTRLRHLTIIFELPALPHSQHPPLTRSIFPALKWLEFRGGIEYLEDLVARINAPQLDILHISFWNEVFFDIQQLPYFIDHTGIFRSYNHAVLTLFNTEARINLSPSKEMDSSKRLDFGVYCNPANREVLSMVYICSHLLPLPSIVEQLDIQVGSDQESTWQVVMEGTRWLELFHQFTAVRTLRISLKLQTLILPALQELTGERAMEGLPALDSLYLEGYHPSGSDQQAIKPFIASRQNSDRPVTVHLWEGR